MTKKELHKELLRSMNQIATYMPEVIFQRYFDKFGDDNKYILAMADDAFKSIDVFCYAIQHVALSQAASVLRQLLEQVSIVCLLVNHRDLLQPYIEHFKFRQDNNQLPDKELIDVASEHYSIANNKSALKYLDYGWLCSEENIYYSEGALIKMAGFEDILSWRKTYLDKFVHASYTTTNLLIDGDFPIINPFIKIATKLFDHLCTSFHKLTDFDFVFDGVDLFHSDFINHYQLLDNIE